MSDKIPPLCDQPKWNHIRHRCCCVFDHDSDEDEPLAECHYHERIRARLAEAERDAVRYRWLRDRAWPFEFNGDTPADADAAIDAAMRPPAKKHTPRPGAHDNIGDVIVQANLASTLTSHPSLSPTHYCVDCGALWRQCDDFSMNLRSASCCDACNNAPVGPQIRPIYVAPSSADVERRPCTCPDGERPIPCPRKFAVSECQAAAGWTDSATHRETGNADNLS